MLRPVRVRDRMRPGAVAVAWGDSAEAALARMREAGLEALPVVNDGRVIGLLERDAVLLCERGGNRLDAVPVTDLMRRGVFVCRADDAVARALAVMDRLGVARLAVLDAAGGLVGVLGRAAAAAALRRLVPAFYGAY